MANLRLQPEDVLPRIRRDVTASLILAAAIACGGESASDRPGGADSAAASLAPVAGPAVQPPATWRLAEEWRVGGEARGPHSFDYNLGLAVLREGHLLHIDYQTSQLHELDARGRPVRSFGRKGSGPGEIAYANGFVVAPDGRIIVNDQTASRFVVFSPTGEYERTVRAAAPRGMGGRWTGVMLDDGRLIETLALHQYERTSDSASPVTLLWVPDLSRADTIPAGVCRRAPAPGTTITLRYPDGSPAAEVPIPLAFPEVPATYDRSGSQWEAYDPTSNMIVRRTIGGCGITSTVRLAGERAPMSSERREQIRERLAEEARRWKAVEPSIDDLPRYQPWYRSVQVDSDANIWVERLLPGGLAVDVFSPSGEALGRIHGDLPSRAVITASHVYGLVRDSLDVSYLAAWRIVR